MIKLKNWSRSKVEKLNYSKALSRAFLVLKEKNKFPEDAQYLIEEISGYNYTQLQLHRNDPVPDEILLKFQIGLNKLLQDIPVQYILNSAYFMGRKFFVDQNVLIPRQETEEMVQKVIDDQSEQNKKILDIGTGSGAIAISLALQFPNDEVVASDISGAALAVAQKNAQRQRVDNISFVESDLFEKFDSQKFDVIVSNPPYIAESEKDDMDESVKKYEPQLALYGKNDGLDFYQRVSKVAESYLTEKGCLYMEFGFRQKNKIASIFTKNMPEYVVEFYKDINEYYRYLKAYRKKVEN